MADSTSKLSLFPYIGGFDSTKHPALLDPQDVVEMDNIIYTTYNTKKLRPGISRIFTATSPYINGSVISCIDFHRLGEQKFVFFDGKLIRAVSTNGEEVDITPPLVFLNGENVFFLVFQGLLITFFGGTSYKPYYWTGTGGMKELTEAPEGCNYGRIWLNSLWLDDPSVKGRIKKSVTGNPLDFTNVDAQDFDLDVNDGDPDGITAIFPVAFKKFYVAKRFSIFEITQLYDSATGGFVFGYDKISDGIGCVSHQGVVAMEDVIIFPSDRGVHHLNQTSKISAIETTFLTKDIQPLWVKEVNFGRSQYMRGVYDNTRNCYLLGFPTAGRSYASSVWGYSLFTGKWFKWAEYNQSCLFRYIDFTDKSIKIGCGASNGEFGFIDDEVYSDYGVKYGCYLQSGIIIPSGMPRNSFQLSKLTLIFTPQLAGKFLVNYKINGKFIETIEFDQRSIQDDTTLGSDFILGITPLGNIPQLGSESVNTKGYGEFFQFIVEYIPDTDLSDNSGFEMLGIIMDLKPVSSTTGKAVG